MFNAMGADIYKRMKSFNAMGADVHKRTKVFNTPESKSCLMVNVILTPQALTRLTREIRKVISRLKAVFQVQD